MMMGHLPSSSSAAFTYAIWNSADKGPDWNLSGTPLLTATFNGAAGSEIVRATKSQSTGRFYLEYVVGTMSTYTSIGIANSTHPLSGQFLGGDSNGMSWLPGGTTFINSVPLGTIGTFVAGNLVCLAFDFTAMKFWGRVGAAGNWNNDVIGNQNPAVGSQVGGLNLSTIATGPWFPAAFGQGNLDSLTANFGQSAYSGAVPTGFGNW